MKKFLIYVRIARKNKGLIYWYDNNGYVYSPCRDLYGAPIMNFRIKDKNGREIYGKELSHIDRNLLYNVKNKNK